MLDMLCIEYLYQYLPTSNVLRHLNFNQAIQVCNREQRLDKYLQSFPVLELFIRREREKKERRRLNLYFIKSTFITEMILKNILAILK